MHDVVYAQCCMLDTHVTVIISSDTSSREIYHLCPCFLIFFLCEILYRFHYAFVNDSCEYQSKMKSSTQVYRTILLTVCLLSHYSRPILSTVITGSSARFNQFSKFILESQQTIIKQLESEDGKATFCQDKWQKGESVSRSECVWSSYECVEVFILVNF